MSDPVATVTTEPVAPAEPAVPAAPVAPAAPAEPAFSKRELANAQAKGLLDNLWGMYTDFLTRNAKHISLIVAGLVIYAIILMWIIWTLMEKVPASTVGISAFQDCGNDMSWRLPDGRGYSGENDNQYGAAASFADAAIELHSSEDNKLDQISAFESTRLKELDQQLVYAPFTCQTNNVGMYEGYADAIQNNIVNAVPGTTDSVQVSKVVVDEELPWGFGKCSDIAPKVPIPEYSDEYLARRWSGRIL